jgi:hypothetical protein
MGLPTGGGQRSRAAEREDAFSLSSCIGGTTGGCAAAVLTAGGPKPDVGHPRLPVLLAGGNQTTGGGGENPRFPFLTYCITNFLAQIIL